MANNTAKPTTFWLSQYKRWIDWLTDPKTIVAGAVLLAGGVVAAATFVTQIEKWIRETDNLRTLNELITFSPAGNIYFKLNGHTYELSGETVNLGYLAEKSIQIA